MAQQPNLFPLKLIVISLGILLVGGTVFVFAAIASKAGKEISAAHACSDVKINLAAKGKVTNVTPQGDSVQVTLVTHDATEVITFDRCSGRILQTLTIAP